MTVTTQTHKTFSKRQHHNQHTKTKQLSILDTVSTRYTRPLSGIWQNERVPMTVRVDKGLKKAFYEVSKDIFGSTCRPLECMMAAFVGCYSQVKNPSVYPPLTIDIGTMKIERNVRSRRKMVIETETETKETLIQCGFKGCDNEATVKGFYKPKKTEVPLCESHLKLICDSNSPDWGLYVG